MKIAAIYDETIDTVKFAFNGMASDIKYALSPLRGAFIFALEQAAPYVPAAKRQLYRFSAQEHFRLLLEHNAKHQSMQGILDTYSEGPVRPLLENRYIGFQDAIRCGLENDLRVAGYDPQSDEPYNKVLRLKGGRAEFEAMFPKTLKKVSDNRSGPRPE